MFHPTEFFSSTGHNCFSCCYHNSLHWIPAANCSGARWPENVVRVPQIFVGDLFVFSGKEQSPDEAKNTIREKLQCSALTISGTSQ